MRRAASFRSFMIDKIHTCIVKVTQTKYCEEPRAFDQKKCLMRKHMQTHTHNSCQNSKVVYTTVCHCCTNLINNELHDIWCDHLSWANRTFCDRKAFYINLFVHVQLCNVHVSMCMCVIATFILNIVWSIFHATTTDNNDDEEAVYNIYSNRNVAHVWTFYTIFSANFSGIIAFAKRENIQRQTHTHTQKSTSKKEEILIIMKKKRISHRHHDTTLTAPIKC